MGHATLDQHGVIIEMNPCATELLSNTRDSLYGMSFYGLIAAQDRDNYYLSRRRLLTTSAPQFCELKILRPGARPFWARLEMSLGHHADAQVCHLAIIDIDESRVAELLATEDRLRRLLDDKDTLLNEVHRQVKNSLEVISSLLRTQGDSLNDSEAAAALKEGRHRVVSMAMIHERLNASRQLDQIDFAEYAQTLVNELFHSYAGSADHVVGRLKVSSVRLKVDLAIPCGLILNELVTSALKYAYRRGRNGEVVVELRESADGLVTLSVSGQGVGLQAGSDWRKSESSGLPIVDLLTRQIGGKVKIQSDPGAGLTVEFLKEGKITHAASA